MAIDFPVPHADKIKWKSDEPVWVNQWPLTSEKLAAATQLVQEQLKAGHLEPTTSPWNTPIFVIKKKTGTWRLLQDLREVNKTMFSMGALQPGLPSPIAIPADFSKIIIDLKDCFFTIPLHPLDRERFAFSLPVVNFKGPMPRYQWKVLPQGMANSPTLCQKFVAQAIDPLRARWPYIYIIHYMDDILLAGSSQDKVLQCTAELTKNLAQLGLQIAPNKIQQTDPYYYLGFELRANTITTQKIQLKTSHLHTLNDFQKFLGDVNWLRPYLKLTTAQLKPLFDLLQGDSDPLSPRYFTREAQQSLQLIQSAIENQQITCISYHQSFSLVVCATPHTPTAVLWQGAPLLWVHLPSSPNKVLTTYYTLTANIIQLGREKSRQHFGKDPDKIILPYTKTQIQWLMQNENDWPVVLSSFLGDIDNHYPADRLLQFTRLHPFIFPKVTSSKPLPAAALVFTDGSSGGRAAYIINNQAFTVPSPYHSAQLVELFAILQVFTQLQDTPFNLYTDSAYIAFSLPLLETVPHIKPSSNAVPLFCELQQLITKRHHPFFIGHLRAHSDLPGPLAQGNALADANTRLALPVLTDPLTRAQQSHALHHLNARTLRLLYKITRDQAREIVKACPGCVTLLPTPHLGVNPRGIIANEIWQMDVTHIPEFGSLKYAHVTIDTYSGFIFASLHTGEATKNVIAHVLQCLTVMGKPQKIKTDNGPGYTSQAFKQFCGQFQICHVTGIPYNPQGQGIVERAHLTLKNTLSKLKASTAYPTKGSYRNTLHHALFVLNFLQLDDQGNSAADRLWHQKTKHQYARVMWRDPLTAIWNGPDPVLIWARGSACVYDTKECNPRWLPARLVKPVNLPNTNSPPPGT